MTNYLAVFRSKTQLMVFIEAMKSHGARVTTTQTPIKAGVGCGLSASFEARYINLARQVINTQSLNSFHAIYKVAKDGIRSSIEKIA